MTRSEAEAAVAVFLARVRRREPGALVHVITGKGMGSPDALYQRIGPRDTRYSCRNAVFGSTRAARRAGT